MQLRRVMTRAQWHDLVEDAQGSVANDPLVASAVWCCEELPQAYLLHGWSGWIICPSPQAPAELGAWLTSSGLDCQAFPTRRQLVQALDAVLALGAAE